MKEELRIKEPIKLRVKHLANGNKSIYLDMYMNGKRKYYGSVRPGFSDKDYCNAACCDETL